MCVVREWLFKASMVFSRVFVPKSAFFFNQYYATGWTLYRFCTLWLQRSFVLWQQDRRNKCPTNSISFWSNQIFFQPVIYSISAWLFVFMRRNKNRLEPGGFKVNIRDRQTITYLRRGKIFVFRKLSQLFWNFGAYFIPLKLCTTKYCKNTAVTVPVGVVSILKHSAHVETAAIILYLLF